MEFNPQDVRENAREATTDDLLDRVTVYREGMEPAAIDIIEAELLTRGISTKEIKAHAEKWSQQPYLTVGDGSAARACSYCYKPAIAEGWRWHWWYNTIPIFQRWMYWCDEHAPRERKQSSSQS